MSFDSIPKELRGLRACLVCSMVKTIDQFEKDGCDNCERFLHIKNDREFVMTCTSSNFDGVIAMVNPDDSWVARWKRIDKMKPGCYAISVSGQLPHHVIRDLKMKGVQYKSRDVSSRT